MDDIYEMLSTILNITLDEIKVIDENDEFSNYGMTSINAIQLVVMLEQKYDIEFLDDDLLLEKFNTMKKLCLLLEGY